MLPACLRVREVELESSTPARLVPNPGRLFEYQTSITSAEAISRCWLYPQLQMCILCSKLFFSWCPHLGQVWEGLIFRVGTSINTPPTSSNLAFSALLIIPMPTSKSPKHALDKDYEIGYPRALLYKVSNLNGVKIWYQFWSITLLPLILVPQNEHFHPIHNC